MTPIGRLHLTLILFVTLGCSNRMTSQIRSVAAASSAASAPIAAAPVAPVTPTAPITSGAKLLWSDEFNALDLASPAKPRATWRPNDIWQNITAGYQDFAGTNWNINPNDPAFAPYTPYLIDDGVLTVRAFRTPPSLNANIKAQMANQGIPGDVPKWSGGMLVLNPVARKFTYGYFEFRARWPKTGRGMFPALWLYSSDLGTDVNGKSAAEIDVLEMFGAAKDWTSTVHLKGAHSDRSRTLGTEPMVDAANFHLYAVDWQPTFIRVYRDGKLVHAVEGEDAAWFNSPMGLRINYAMDAPWMAPNGVGSDASTPTELAMELDYVRVYDRRP